MEEEASKPVMVKPGFIQTLVILAHNIKAGIPASFFVGGKWFTGEITSERAFLEESAALFSDGLARATGMPVEEVTAGLRAGSFKHLLEQETQEEGNLLPEFVYLKDVEIIDGPNRVRLDKPIVRIVLASVAAFQFGRMSIR